MSSKLVVLVLVASIAVSADVIKPPAGKVSPAVERVKAAYKSLAAGDVKAAEQQFRASLKLDSGLGAAHVGLAQIELKNNRPKQAELHLQRALSSDPANSSFQRSWAAFLTMQNRLGEAEAAYRRAVELDAKSSPAWKDLGDFLLMHRSDVPSAIRAFESALKLEPSADTQYSLGTAYAQARNWARAEQAFRKSARLAPQNPSPLHSLGLVLLEQGKFDPAIEAFNSVLNVDPSFAASRVGRGDALAAKGNPERALSDYSEALKAQGRSTEILSRIAVAQQQGKRFPEAERVWQEVLRAEPDNPSALNNLAFLYAEQRKQLDQALTWARRAVQLTQGAPEAQDTLAWVHRARGESAQALAVLEKVARGSRDPAILYHLGVIYDETGRKPDATRALKAALATGKPFDGLADAKARLSR